MARLLNVLGTDFLVGPQNDLIPQTAGITARPNWKLKTRVNLQAMKVRLEGGLEFGATGLAYFELELPIVARGADYVLADHARRIHASGRFHVMDRNAPPIARSTHIELDSLTLEDSQVALAVAAGGIQVWARPLNNQFPQMPFEFLEPQGHLDVNLGGAEVSAAADALQLKTFCECPGQPRAFVRVHASLPFVARVGQPIQPPTPLKFRGDAKGLPLHVEWVANTFVSGLLAEKFELHAAFRSNTLDKLELAGPNVVLATASLMTPANEMARLRTNEPLKLAIRRGRGAPASGFMVSPQQDAERRFRFADDKIRRLHGAIDSTVFEGLATATLECTLRQMDEAQPPTGAAKGLLFDYALGWLRFDSKPVMSTMRPGASFSGLQPGNQNSSGNASLWSFQGDVAAIPLLPRECVEAARAFGMDPAQHQGELNAAMAKLKMATSTARHETALRVDPGDDKPVGLDKAYVSERQVSGPLAGKLATGEHPVRALPHEVRLAYGPITINAELSTTPIGGEPERPPDYIIIWDDPGDIVCVNECVGGAPHFRMGRDDKFRIASKPAGQAPVGGKGLPLALIKLNPDLTMPELFALVDSRRKTSEPKLDLSFETPFEGDIGLVQGLPVRMRGKGWTGMLLFNCDLDLKGFAILATLVGDKPGIIRLKYVAITPEAVGGRFSVAGAAWWKNPNLALPAPPYKPNTPDPLEAAEEVRFISHSVQVAWDDTRLTQFRYKGEARFPSLFGRVKPAAPRLEILGSVNEDTQEIQFIGQLDEELEIFHRDDGLLRSVRIRRAEIRDSKGKVSLDLDGGIDLGKATFDGGGGGILDWFEGLGRSVDFSRLGINFDMPQAPDAWRNLSFSYPSFKFNLDDLHFKFFGMDNFDLKLFMIGVDWKGTDFDWSRFLAFGNVNLGKSFLLGLRFDFSALPDIALDGLERLQFDLQLGIGLNAGDWNNTIRAAISAVSFSPFKLGLLRFLEVSADSVALQPVNAKWNGQDKSIPVIAVTNARVKLLGAELFDNLSISAFTLPDGRRGFFASWVSDDPREDRWLDVKWAVIAYRAFLPEAFARQIVSLEKPDAGDGVADSLKDHVAKNSFVPKSSAAAGMDEWTFAASISLIGGGLKGRFLVQDKKYYGLVLDGVWLEEWFGYKFAISALYIKRERAAEDSFLVQVRIPGVTVGSIRFMGGVIGIEIAVNGGFMLDAGFPWLQDGGPRAWDRTFGAIMTPFQGSGGFYLARRSTVTKTGDNLDIISAGYAVQGGLGATFGGGVFTVWVRAGVYAIFEGEAHVRFADGSLEIQRLVVTGAVGILVEGAGELRFWIISATVHVIAQAEARATINVDFVTGDPIIVKLAFELSARASARACIGSGWFKVCKGISVRVSMPFYQTMRIG